MKFLNIASSLISFIAVTQVIANPVVMTNPTPATFVASRSTPVLQLKDDALIFANPVS
jgi:hypothetical protein